jgi:WD40 repeat protein/beta-lactamase regulating signal transducer with metallopeptidase domain
MMNALEQALPAWLLVRWLNVALASLVAFGIALALSGRRAGSLPFRHAVLVAAMIVGLIVPGECFLLGDAGFARFPINDRAVASALDPEQEPGPSDVARAAREPADRMLGNHDATALPRPSLATATNWPARTAGDSTLVVPSALADQHEPQTGRSWSALSERLVGTVLAGIWLLGTLFGAARAILRRRALARWSRMFEPCLSSDVLRAARVAAEATGLRGALWVLESEVVPAPVTFGLLRPRIVVPAGLGSELPFEQLCAVMRHEAAHIARGDLWIGVIQEFAHVAYWWNPLARLANRRLTDVREQICDDIATVDLIERRDYAALLVGIATRCATGKRVPAALGLGASQVRQLEQRVRRILDSRAGDTVRLGRRAAFGVLGIAAVMTATMLFAQLRLQSPGESPADPVATNSAAEQAPEMNGTALLAAVPFASGNADRTEEPGKSARSAHSKPVDLYGNPIPAGAVVRLGAVPFRHAGPRKELAIAADNRTLISASWNGEQSLKFWDAPRGRLLGQIDLVDEWFQSMSISPDRSTVATLAMRVGKAGTQPIWRIKLWDIASRKLKSALEWTQVGVPQFGPIALLNDGKSAVVGTTDGKLVLIDLAAKREKCRWTILKDWQVWALAVSPDSKLAAVTAGRKTSLVSLFKASEAPRELPIHHDVASLAFSPDGKSLAVGLRAPGKIELWDFDAPRVIRNFDDRDAGRLQIGAMAFTPNGKTLILASADDRDDSLVSSLLLWNVETGQLEAALPSSGRFHKSLAVSADGQLVATAPWNGPLEVWNLKTSKRLGQDLAAHEFQVNAIAFVPARKLVVTASDDGTARIWDQTTGRQLQVLEHDRWVRGLAVTADGQFAATSSLDDTVRVWRIDDGKEVRRFQGHGRVGGFRKLAFSTSGTTLSSWGDDMILRRWNVLTGELIGESDLSAAAKRKWGELEGRVGPSLNGRLQTFSGDGRLFLFVDPGEGAARQFDGQTGKERLKHGFGAGIGAIALSADGSQVVLAGDLVAKEPSTTAATANVSPTNRRVVAVQRLQTGETIWRQELADSRRPTNAAFSADGALVAIGFAGSRASILVFDARDGRLNTRMDDVTLVTEGETELAFSPNGTTLAAAQADSSVLLWNIPRPASNR